MRCSTTITRLQAAAGCVARTAPRILTAATASIGVACLILTTACYTYDVKAPTDVVTGQRIEVVVNNIGRVAVAADLGEDVAKIDGDFVSLTDSVLKVRVTELTFVNESTSDYPGSVISIPRLGVVSVSTKQFSRSKTTIVAVGLTALVVALIATIGIGGLGGSSGSKDSNGGGAVQ